MSDTEPPLQTPSGPPLPAPGTRTPRLSAPAASDPFEPASLDWVAQRAGARRIQQLAMAALADPATAWRELHLAASRVEAAGKAIKRSPRRDYGRLMREMEKLMADGVVKRPTQAARLVMKGEPEFAFTSLMRRWRAAGREG